MKRGFQPFAGGYSAEDKRKYEEIDRRAGRVGSAMLGFLFASISVGTYEVHRAWWIIAFAAVMACVLAWREVDDIPCSRGGENHRNCEGHSVTVASPGADVVHELD